MDEGNRGQAAVGDEGVGRWCAKRESDDGTMVSKMDVRRRYVKREQDGCVQSRSRMVVAKRESDRGLKVDRGNGRIDAGGENYSRKIDYRNPQDSRS